MKSFTRIVVGLLALCVAGAVYGQNTYVRITGAQGLRGAVNQAVVDILKPGFTVGYAHYNNATSASGTLAELLLATNAIYTGTTVVGNYPVIIKTALSSTSTGGVRALTTNLVAAGTSTASTEWLQDTIVGSNLTLTATAYESGTMTADVAVSGEYQNTTRWPAPQFTQLTDWVMGVFPYVWLRNSGSPYTLSNINATLAQLLFSNGSTELSQFTGNASDAGTNVFLIGRDEGASSRETLYAESGFGIYSVDTQYELDITGTAGPSGTVVGAEPYPAATVDGISFALGHSGYTTFGSLAAALNTPGSLTSTGTGTGTDANSGPIGGWVIGYSDLPDAVTVVPGISGSATAVVSGGAISSITVTNGGSNYCSSPSGTNYYPLINIVDSSGSGTGATAVATVVSGTITGITVTNPGSGYNGPTTTVSITGGAIMSWNGVAYSPSSLENGQYTYWSYAHMMTRPTYSTTGPTGYQVAIQLEQDIFNGAILSANCVTLSSMKCQRSGDGTYVSPGAANFPQP